MGELREERKQFYGMTRQRTNTNNDVNGNNNNVTPSQNGKGHQHQRQHRHQLSYSSTNTDGDGDGEGDDNEGGIGEGDRSGVFGLDEGDMSFSSVTTGAGVGASQSGFSVRSEESGTNQSTPVMGRRIGYLRDGRSATPV